MARAAVAASTGALCAVLAVCAVAAPAASDAGLVQSGPVLSEPGERGAHFGSAVALSGNGAGALVGALDAGVQDGAAFFFVRSGSTLKQQGPTIKGSTAASLGYSVALSANGNTALIAEPVGVGHVWVYTRSGAIWSRRAELTGKGVQDNSGFGNGLALSGDGNTALVGDPDNDGNAGAVWVFTRSGSRWTQGPKFTGGGDSETFGASVALSADGTTALIGWSGDHDFAGVVQVYTRSGSSWKAGPPLTGRGETAGNGFGALVALSADGDTAFVVGQDLARASKVWAFTRSGGAWTQTQLSTDGTDVFNSLALSGDGKTALVGARADHGGAGAVLVYTRSVSGWSRRTPLTARGATGLGFGNSVSISTNGRVALVGSDDDSGAGAAWLFAAPSQP